MLSSVAYTVHLLFQSKLCLDEHVDLVFLSLKVVQNLLMSFLQGTFLSVKRPDGLVQHTHLLGQVLHLHMEEKQTKPNKQKKDSGSISLVLNVTQLVRFPERLKHLVLHSVSILLHFGQRHLQVVHVPLQRQDLVVQQAFLGRQLGTDLLLVLQTFLHLLQLGLLRDFGLNQLVAAIFCISQVVLFL